MADANPGNREAALYLELVDLRAGVFGYTSATSGSVRKVAMNARGVSLALMAAGLLAVCLSSPVTAMAASSCRQGADAWVWVAPLSPQPGEPLTVLAVATGGDLDQVQVTDPGGRRTGLRTSRGGGPPWHLQGTLPAPQPGVYRIEATRGGRVLACAEAKVGGGAGDRGSGDWDLAAQALYAAWIERLFDAPPNESLSFPSLAPVLADPGRNFLYGYLGQDEDKRLPAEPDCADLSYFLRAYFAWKLGLPIAYRSCSRGSRNSPPRCEAPTIDRAFAGPPAPAGDLPGRQPEAHGPGPLRQRAHGPGGRGHGLLSGPPGSRGCSGRVPSTRTPTATP
jgi:hypothetical protein